MRYSIPAFIEQIAPEENKSTQYSRAKLKIFYVGETVDHRVFTQTFADKLLQSLQYTPVVGYYSAKDQDFVGHNSEQQIYGMCPSAEFEYVEENGVKYAVTDVILYTERPDQTGYIAEQIIGKQHSLELLPDSVEYVINRDADGNFKNIEFTNGVLIGLSVLGDTEKPAFTGSEFFSDRELPDFITDENRVSYLAAFERAAHTPTMDEMWHEIYAVLETNRVDGWVAEYIPYEYVTIGSWENVANPFQLYKVVMTEGRISGLELVSTARRRFITDEEVTLIDQIRKGTSVNEPQPQTEEEVATATTEASDASSDDATQFGASEEQPAEQVGEFADGSDNGEPAAEVADGESEPDPVATPETDPVEEPPVEETPEADPVEETPAEETTPAAEEGAPIEEGEPAPAADPVPDFAALLSTYQQQFEQRIAITERQCKVSMLSGYRSLLPREVYDDFSTRLDSLTIDDLSAQLAEAYDNAATGTTPYAVSFGVDEPNAYDPTDVNQVMAKYNKH